MSLDITGLKTHFSGRIITPEDEAYEQARVAFMNVGSPAVVVTPQSTSDIVTALQFARDNSLVVSVRSGGHSGPGFGTNSGGLVIDMSHFNQVEVIDADQHLVKVGSGAVWQEVAEELQKHNLALSSGDTKSVGVGGLTLGGGIGWLVRQYGLTIDSLVAAEMVLANGEVVRTSETERTDLFWALRGGGGNFGIVTYFEFSAHSLRQVHAGMIQYPLENLSSILTGWRDALRAAPVELNSSLMVVPAMGENPASVMILVCYADDDEAKAKRVIEPLRQLGSVKMDTISQKNYADVLEEAHPPQGVKVISKNTFIPQLTDEFIATLSSLFEQNAGAFLQLRYLDGLLKQVPTDKMAFSHRQVEALMLVASFVPMDASEELMQKALLPWQTLKPYGTGAYLNLLSAGSDEDVAAAYPPEVYQRLAEIKKQYDPHNLFNQNYNIKPTSNSN